MARFFVRMPRLGETVDEGIIGRWLVKPGDRVAELDVIVEVSTDKVDTELPAPVSGVVAELLAPEGATVPIGGRIAVIDQQDGGSAMRTAPESEATEESSNGN